MSGVLEFVLSCFVFLGLVLAVLWAFGVFGRLLLSLEGRPLTDNPSPRLIEITARDRQLVANGWHPDDVIAARRNGIELPDRPGQR